MKQFLFKAIAGILMSLITLSAMGQNLNPADMLTMKGHMVKSSTNQKTYQLYVSLPPGYNSSGSVRHPVLYVLDGSIAFPLVSIRSMLDFNREIENVIIVSIGDSIQALPNWFVSRWTDYTPSFDAKADSATSAQLNIPQGILKSGGAQAFLVTIRRDIIPLIDKLYKTTDDRGLAGHSLGGLFTGYCLLTAPDLFKRYGINSPSFWWNNKELLSREDAFLKQKTELDAKIFISVGSLETNVMISPMTAFGDALKSRNYKGLTLTSIIFDNETHGSVIPASLTRAIRVLYGAKVKGTYH